MRGHQWGLAPALLFFAGRSVFAALERPLRRYRRRRRCGLQRAANNALIFGKFGMPALAISAPDSRPRCRDPDVRDPRRRLVIDPRMRAAAFALPWVPARREFAALWQLGLLIGGTIMAEVGVFSAATLVIGLIGPAALEGHTIALQIASLAYMVPLGPRTGGDGQGRSCLWRARSARNRARRLVGLRRHGRLRPPRRRRYRRAAAPHRAVHRPRWPANAATEASPSRCSASRQSSRSSTRARRRSPTCCAACTIRALPLVMALIGYWAMGAPVGLALGFGSSARRSRRLDRPCDRSCDRRRSSDGALARHGAAGVSW